MIALRRAPRIAALRIAALRIAISLASALTYAQVKAIASGNPMVIEKARIDTEIARIYGVQCMFGIDECRFAAILLYRSHGMQGDGGFAGGLRAINFNDATTR